MTKVLHFGSIDVNSGGPAMSTYLTLLGLQELGLDVRIAMYPLSKTGRLRGTGVPVSFMRAPLDGRVLYSCKLKKELSSLGDFDIYHAQGVWQWPTYAIADTARKKRKPYVITPRGMLYPQDIAKSNAFFKKISLKVRLLNDLNNAACVHVTCEDEMRYCRNLGVTAPIAIIPNPVEIKEYSQKKKDNIFRVGYLGRISRRKNVEGLIYAFNTLKEQLNDSELLIIGGGDKEYEDFLRKEVSRLGLRNVRFAGFLSGEEKDIALSSCSVLAMPSEFENLGNVILEGLVRKIPCIATWGAPWKELSTWHCGWHVPYSQEAITNAIWDSYNTSTEDLKAMGENGRRLMETRYSVDAVSNDMKQLYEWILEKESKPSFLYEQ